MIYSYECSGYYKEDSPDFLVEYRGNFKEQIDKVSYACGDIITDTIGVVSVPEEYMDRLLKDVPAIIFVDNRAMFVLEDISPNEIGNIADIKANPYLALTGKGVLIGIVDTGIDYLNEEFTKEDGTSRIMSIWDQTIQDNTDTSVYIGQTYDNETINSALNAYRDNKDPYEIVPSKDEVGHGTEIAGIIGARGYNNMIKGIAPDSDFVIVKLLESLNFKKRLRENGVKYIPTYNSSEIVAGIEYLKDYALKAKRPIAIYLAVGSTEGTHDGNNLISKYLTSIAEIRGIALVAGVGNEGDAEGHASGVIENVGDINTVELKISKEMKYFNISIVVQRPNKASVNIISPAGEASMFISPKINKSEKLNFILTDTEINIKYNIPDRFTGHEIVTISFFNIKTGIWKFQLRGEYIINGKYNIWLAPKKTLPPDTNFLKPDPYTTLTIPSTARKVLTVAYVNYGNLLVASSGKGYNSDEVINPDITTVGIDILTTQVGGGITTISGSSAATAIVTGASALLLQWGIVDRNDTTMYSTKVKSYIIYGADRQEGYKYPNRETGYGYLNLQKTFNIIGRAYREEKKKIINKDKYYIEYYVNKLFIRLPITGGL